MCDSSSMMVRCGILVVFFASTALVSARWLKPSDASFEEVLAKRIKENEKRDGSIHGHIVAVNEASRSMTKKEAQGNIPLTEEIEAANEAGNNDLFEGDIELTNDDSQDVSQSETDKRNIIKSKGRLWPNKEVPFYVSPELGNLKGKINSAINAFRKHTCVRFKEVPGSYSGDHIRLVKGRGCSSSVGRRGGGQKLYLGQGCEYVGVIMHEMMHSLGIWHEQSRPDRDRYVEVLWHNVAPGRQKNFRKYPHGKLDTLNLPYDTSSIMHYDRYLFSKSPKKPTMIARGRPWKKLGGQLRGTFTSNDAKEINSLFNC